MKILDVEKIVEKVWEFEGNLEKVRRFFNCSITTNPITRTLEEKNIDIKNLKRAIKEEKENKIIQRAEELKSIKKAAQSLRVSESAVSAILRKREIKIHSYENLDEDEVINKTQELGVLKEIAQYFNCSNGPIRRILKKRKIRINWKYKHTGKVILDKDKVIEQAKKLKGNLLELSRFFECSSNEMFLFLKQNNLLEYIIIKRICKCGCGQEFKAHWIFYKNKFGKQGWHFQEYINKHYGPSCSREHRAKIKEKTSTPEYRAKMSVAQSTPEFIAKRTERIKKQQEMTHVEWKCKFCGKMRKFSLSGAKKKYCNSECRKKAVNINIRFCEKCGEKTKSISGFCPKCQPRKIYICKVCRNKITKERQKRSVTYCSNKCEEKNKVKITTTKALILLAQGQEVKNLTIKQNEILSKHYKFCPICKKHKFFRTLEQKTCSRKCSNIMVSGYNNWGWKTGKYVKPHSKVITVKERRKMELAYDRDNHICQLCDRYSKLSFQEECRTTKKGEKLLVHHIIDPKISPDLPLWNFITLCFSCHGPLFRDMPKDVSEDKIDKIKHFLSKNNNSEPRLKFSNIRREIAKIIQSSS